MWNLAIHFVLLAVLSCGGRRAPGYESGKESSDPGALLEMVGGHVDTPGSQLIGVSNALVMEGKLRACVAKVASACIQAAEMEKKLSNPDWDLVDYLEERHFELAMSSPVEGERRQ